MRMLVASFRPAALLAALCGASLFLTACSNAPEPAASPRTELPPAPTGTASIRGTVRFAGTPPRREPVRIGNADPTCHKTGDGQPPLMENVVVNENGTLRDVIIYVKAGLPQGSYAVTSEPAILNQVGCVYEPHVIALQTGQELKVLNSDDTVHNVNGQGNANARFNFSMINAKVPPRVLKFDRPEFPPMKIKCDVHPWMLAWAAVFDHPYFDVTGLEGTFEITGLPAGEYTIETWHQEYAPQTHTVKLADGEQKELELTFSPESGAGK